MAEIKTAEIKTAEIRPFCLKRYMALFGMRFACGLFCGALAGALLFLLLDADLPR